MAMKRTHDAVYVEKYTDRNGEEKKRYTNIGSLMTREDGSMTIKLEAIPVNFTGWISLYEPKERDEKPAPARPAARKPAPADDFEQESVPF